MKKLWVIPFALLLNHCFGQTPDSSNNKYYLDTLKLFTPKPAGEDIASPKDYEHGINLTGIGYTTTLNGHTYSSTNTKELKNVLRSHKTDIIKQVLCIICDSATSSGKIIDVLNLMSDLDIKKYKLVDDRFYSNDDPIVVVKPVETKTVVNDSVSLKITFVDPGFEISLLKEKLKVQNLNELETYLISHKKNIDPNQIELIANSGLQYSRFKQVVSLLKKYKYARYRLVTL